MAATAPQFDTRAEQQFAALRQANYVRTMRSQLKRDVAAGRARVSEYVLDPPEFAEGMEIYDLLIALPRWGRCKTTTRLRELTISPHRQLVSLTMRERERVTASLNGS